MRSRWKKYSREELTRAVQSSRSLRQALGKLGVATYGGNYEVIKKSIAELKLDTSHFTGKSWNRHNHSPRTNTADYLSNKIAIPTHKLKLRLIKEGYFAHCCYGCQKTMWRGVPIPLELHHKDGNRANNNLINLELLCPNCHALTSTYRGKNKSS